MRSSGVVILLLVGLVGAVVFVFVVLVGEEETWLGTLLLAGKGGVSEERPFTGDLSLVFYRSNSPSRSPTKFPTTQSPTSSPTTSSPTTLSPTTSSPTTSSPTTSSPTVAPKFFGMWNGAGGVCNLALATALAFAKADEVNGTVVVTKEWEGNLNFFDTDIILRNSNADFIFQESLPKPINIVSGLAGLSCGFHNSFNFTRDVLRPAREYREQAERYITSLRQKSEKILAIHLRHYETDCKEDAIIEFMDGWRPCHASSQYQADINQTCRYELNQQLIDLMKKEWPETANVTSLGMFVSSDRQLPKFDQTFEDENNMKRYNVSATLISPKGTHMMVDMWASTLSDYYIGSPASSCDPIVAQWRSSLGKAQTSPIKCFEGFDHVQHGPVSNAACFVRRTTR